MARLSDAHFNVLKQALNAPDALKPLICDPSNFEAATSMHNTIDKIKFVANKVYERGLYNSLFDLYSSLSSIHSDSYKLSNATFQEGAEKLLAILNTADAAAQVELLAAFRDKPGNESVSSRLYDEIKRAIPGTGLEETFDNIRTISAAEQRQIKTILEKHLSQQNEVNLDRQRMAWIDMLSRLSSILEKIFDMYNATCKKIIDNMR
jgi:hypothetical protein